MIATAKACKNATNMWLYTERATPSYPTGALCSEATGKKDAREATKLVGRARKEVEVKVSKLDCDLKDAIIISASDAAYAHSHEAIPKGASCA